MRSTGIIYADHDFSTNFVNAVGFNDEFMLQDIMIDEIAKLIVEQKKEVVDLLRENGYNVTIKDNTERLSNLISDQIEKNNTNIISGLTKMIAARNDMKSFSADSKLDTTLDKATAALNALTTEQKSNLGWLVGTGLSKVFKKKETKKATTTTAKTPTAAELLAERVKLAEMNAAKNKKTFPTWAKITLISVAAIGLIIGILVIVKQLKKGSPVSSAPAI